MALNKKGIIFSLIAIALSGLFVVLFASTYEQETDDRNSIVRTRVLALDDAITGLYSYAESAHQQAAEGALEGLYDEVDSNGFLADFNQSFTDCLQRTSGTCTNPHNLTGLLHNYTELLEGALGTDINATVNGARLVSEGYWRFTLESNITVTVDDKYASWSLSKNVTARVSTLGTPDPAYIKINNDYGGSVKRPIKKNEIVGGGWNISTFTEYFTGRDHHASGEGPCLSQRYEGDFGNPWSSCGLESVVDPDEHPDLKDSANEDIVHLDWQVLNGETHGCDGEEADFRVSVNAVNKNLTLAKSDAQRFGLWDDHVWYNPSVGKYTARGCDGFS